VTGLPTSSPGFVLYFSVAQAPAVMGMSPRWIREEIRKGLPCLRTAGKILLDPIRVRSWMESHYQPKSVDLTKAYEMAEALTSRRSRKERMR
jgi:hypothetical protein